MSWKLAELRWRQEAGLQDNYDIDVLNKTRGKKTEVWSAWHRDRQQLTTGNDFTAATVWSRLSRERPRDGRLDPNRASSALHGLTAQLVSDLDSSISRSPHLSVSSATPLLLNVPRTRSTFSFSYVGRSPSDNQESKLTIFPHHEEPCTLVSRQSPSSSAASLAVGQLLPVPRTSSGNVFEQELDTITSNRGGGSEIPITRSQNPSLDGFCQIRCTSGPPLDPSIQARISSEHAVSGQDDTPEDRGKRPDERYSIITLGTAPFHISELDFDRFEGPNLEPSNDHSTPLTNEVRPEAAQSLESCILSEHVPESSRVSPTSQRRATRPLYPDLPSAHAKILGCTNKGDSLQPSSEFDLRFPLACSISSGEVDEKENIPDPAMQDMSIPLRDLPRREVLSAQGVLHEAEYHQESSAVFETSDISEDPALSRRESITLDEIVSQYGNRTPPRSSCYHKTTYHQALKEIEDITLDHVPSSPEVGPAEDIGIENQVNGQILRPDLPSGLPDGSSPREIRAESLQSTPVVLPNQTLEFDESDEEWQRTPRSSRCGFLTPSKMRFRLTRRDPAEAEHSSSAIGRSPVSPWDPFRRSTSKRRRQRTFQDDALQRTQAGALVSTEVKKDMAVGSISSPISQEHKMLLQGLRVPPLEIQNSSRLNHTPVLDGDVFNLMRAGSSTGPLSANYSTHFSTETPNSVMPSSSLLPELNKKTLRVRDLSKSGEESEISRSGGNHGVHFRSSMFDDPLADNSYRGSQGLEGVGRANKSQASSGSARTPWNANGRGRKPSLNETSKLNTGSTRAKQPPSAGASLQHLWQSDWNDDDIAISRFLRNRHLGERGNLVRNAGGLSEAAESDLGIKVAGSSLADYSSSATPRSRKWGFGPGVTVQHERRAATNTSEDVDRTNGIVGPRVTSFTPRHQAGAGNSGSYGALSRIESGGMTLGSSNSTSASLLSRSRHEPLSMEMRQEIQTVETCPAFPLTVEQLEMKPNGTGRAPYERLQLLSNGEWLERGWCLVHRRNEFSHAGLTTRRNSDEQEEGFQGQHQAGRLLLGLGVATYFVGGFALIHDMGRQGPVSQLAMREAVRGRSGFGQKEIGDYARVSIPVHRVEAEMARMVERTGIGAAVVILIGCFGVCVWAAIVS